MTSQTASYLNEPTLELRRSSVRHSLTLALAELDSRLPLEVPLIIGPDTGEGAGLESTDPGRPSRVVAAACRASAGDARAAVAAARTAFDRWNMRPASERAAALARAAELLRRRRLELASLQVRECAKPWADADADVCEAIDYLEYYARAAVELERGRSLGQVLGERNSMRYVGCGVVAVIAPWNFPLAIPTGMTAAALAAGNAVVLKPAEQSPGSALMLVQALREAGVPEGAVNLLPGYGDVGQALVRDPGVNMIAFTGSSAVGLEIIQAAAECPPAQRHIKRVVAEMGGKNCVIVDSDADLDEAIPAITISAFGYAGQKCSAASRVLAHEAIVDALLRRLEGAVRTLVVGQAEGFETSVPPLIEREAQQRVSGYAQIAAADGDVLVAGEALGEGWFCHPVLCARLRSDSAVLFDEVFGPLLTVEAVSSVEEACDRVDSLDFALTGGLYSRSPRVIEAVARRTPVGNLYVNRPITGAVVGRQPFGGNRRSGSGSKAGGPDYLLQFAQARVMCENTTRHGLVME